MAFPVVSNNYQAQVLENGGVRVQSFPDFTVIHLPVYTNTTRPAANTLPAGYAIWNTSDSAPNYSDGVTYWRDALGNIT